MTKHGYPIYEATPEGRKKLVALSDTADDPRDLHAASRSRRLT